MKQKGRVLWEQILGENLRSFPWSLQIPQNGKLDQWVPAFGTRKNESRKKWWAEAIKLPESVDV